jgi:serine/threonine protein kinase/WD40 repeat protein
MDSTDKRIREKALFEQALDLESPAERQAFLKGACGPDLALAARVRELLGAHEATGGFLPGKPADRTTLLPVSEKPGDHIGRYKLLQQIGEGGCGVVYMAEQEEPMRRRVALKVIKLGMDTRQVIARFEAERQALAMMDHPNIAKVLDAGATETGRPYFVMELVRGIKITEYCDQNHLSPRQRLDLFIPVCQAIQHAHQKGVIHRDIKPSNILVTLHDGVPVPKVIDFGIAKAIEGRLTDQTLFTAFEQFMGTPAYMSPEQAEMSGLDVDTRSDIYSLGVLLYELLTGRTPLDAKELLAAGLDELRRTIREKDPVRPSTRLRSLLEQEKTTEARRRGLDVPRLIHLLSGDLDWIVMKCLEKDRTRRYETANGLAMDIQRHLQNEPVVARPPTTAYRFQKAVRRHKLAFSAGAAIVLALGTGLGLAAMGWRHARTERDKARNAQVGEEEQKKKAQASALLAQQQKQRAETQESVAKRIAYAANINLVQHHLAANRFGKANDGLDELRPKPGEPELRGWEWRFLWQQCQSEALFTLCRMKPSVPRLAVSADGRWLAMDSGEGLSIWDLRTRKEIDRPKAGNRAVRVAFASNRPWLAFSEATTSESSDPTFAIHIRDVALRSNVMTLSLHGECRGLAFSRDGKTLTTYTDPPDNQITSWSMPDGQKQQSYPAFPHFRPWQGTSFAVAQDASVAVYANSKVTGPATVRVIDLRTGRELWSKQVSDDALVQSLAIAPDNKVLASGAGFADPEIHLWDLASGDELSSLTGHVTYCQSLAFSPDGKTLASASADQTVRLWDVSNPSHPEAKEVLRGHLDEVASVAWIPGSTGLVSGGKDGTVCIWDTAKPRPSRGLAIVRLRAPIARWRFSADSQSVIAVGQDGTVARCYGNGLRDPEPLLRVGTNLADALISEDCRWLAAGLSNGIVEVWDLETRTRTNQLHSHAGLSVPSAFLHGGKQLLLSDWGRVYEQWDLTTGQIVTNWPGPDYWKSHPVTRGERWCLITGITNKSAPYQIVLRDLQTGQEFRTNFSRGYGYGGAISPNGDQLAVANNWGTVSVFRIPTLELVAEFRRFFQGAHSTAYSADGSRLVAGGGGIEAVKLFDATNYRELLTLSGKGAIFLDTQFSPDGNWLGSVNLNGALYLWCAPSWEEIAAREASEKKEGEERARLAEQVH